MKFLVEELKPSTQKFFGSILSRSFNEKDIIDQEIYEIPKINLVIVDIYPFKETLNNTNDEDKIIEKIDIGGLSLIRAAAKNYNDVTVIHNKKKYNNVLKRLKFNNFFY